MESPKAPAAYDEIGRDYARTRLPEPSFARAIEEALVGCSSILNVGAGTGSYEPASTVVAAEPSMGMIRQRPSGSAPAIRAAAEHLPLADASVDAALAVLTIHHWASVEAGMSELCRVTRDRLVILTADIEPWRKFWLVDEYFPAILRMDEERIPSIGALSAWVEDPSVRILPVPTDCADGFTGAYWSRPEAYLDATTRAGMSGFQVMNEGALAGGLTQLQGDLLDGTWDRNHGALRDRSRIDLGYRLLTGRPRA